MNNKALSSFRLKPLKKVAGYKLTYRSSWRNPAVRASSGMQQALETFLAQREDKASPPNEITLGQFTRAGFRPSGFWIAALELAVVQQRICEDLAILYGPGGEYEDYLSGNK